MGLFRRKQQQPQPRAVAGVRWRELGAADQAACRALAVRLTPQARRLFESRRLRFADAIEYMRLPPDGDFPDDEPDQPFEDWQDYVDFSDIEEACSLVARDATGQPVGYVVTDENGLCQFGVLPDRRRHGLARAMVAEAIARLRTLDDRPAFVDVYVNADNTAAIRLLKGCGSATNSARCASRTSADPPPTGSLTRPRSSGPARRAARTPGPARSRRSPA